MGELWIINQDGILDRKKINHQIGERHINGLNKYLNDNNIEIRIDDSIYNSSVIMARHKYCIIDIDNENIILFLPENMTILQKMQIKKYMPIFQNKYVNYVDVKDEEEECYEIGAVTKIYKKIKKG